MIAQGISGAFIDLLGQGRFGDSLLLQFGRDRELLLFQLTAGDDIAVHLGDDLFHDFEVQIRTVGRGRNASRQECGHTEGEQNFQMHTDPSIAKPKQPAGSGSGRGAGRREAAGV